MQGGPFGGPGRFPFGFQRARPQIAPLLSPSDPNNYVVDGPSFLLQAAIVPGDKTTEGQLVEAVAIRGSRSSISALRRAGRGVSTNTRRDAKEVGAMVGVLTLQPNLSKGLVTTTSTFALASCWTRTLRGSYRIG